MPCNTFLWIFLSIFSENTFQTPRDFFSNNCILTSLEEGMSKVSPVKAFHHTQSFTSYYWPQSNYHGIQICIFIFNISKNILKPYCQTLFFKRSCKLLTNACLDVSNASNQPIIMCLGIQSFLKNSKPMQKHNVLLWTFTNQNLAFAWM